MPFPTRLIGLTGPGGIVATPGYSIFLLPWAGLKATSGTWTRDQNAVRLGGGMLDSAGAQNNSADTDEWFDAGTFKLASIYYKDTEEGIQTWKIGGSSVGTIDSYAASSSENNYTEITGITVAQGLQNLQVIAATKNGSSSNYYLRINSAALIRTGA